ncbi:MAG: oligosaccharide flippase family protein [Desulfobacteraceae bacterium]|jgi:O-antigen/teichoic acid export membrane protein
MNKRHSSSARVIARNLAANWIGYGANLVVMFFLSPFVIHTLGLAGYGLWSALNVLVGYMGVLDLGIRASTGRHIILYIGREDHKAVDETIRTSLGFFTALSIVFIIIGTIIGWAFPSLFPKVPKTYHDLLIILVPVMTMNLWVSMIRVVLSSVLSAHDRFDLARGIDLTILAVRTIGTILALSLGYGIPGLVVAVLGSNSVGLLASYLTSKRVYPLMRVWPFEMLWLRLRELFGYGIPAAISSAALKIIAQTDVIVVSACIGFGEAGVYTAGAALLNYASTFLGQIRTTFFPPIQRAVARAEMGSARWLYFRQVRLGLFCGLPVFIGFILFGRDFLHLWLYDPVKFPNQAILSAAWVMAILAMADLSILFRLGGDAFLMAMGYVKFTAGLGIAQAILNLGITLVFVLIFKWGLMGVAGGTLAARMMTSAFVMPLYICYKAKISISHYFYNIVLRGGIAGLIFAMISFYFKWLFNIHSWLVFGTQICLSIIFYTPIAFLILVPDVDRNRFYKKIANMFNDIRARV